MQSQRGDGVSESGCVFRLVRETEYGWVALRGGGYPARAHVLCHFRDNGRLWLIVWQVCGGWINCVQRRPFQDPPVLQELVNCEAFFWSVPKQLSNEKSRVE